MSTIAERRTPKLTFDDEQNDSFIYYSNYTEAQLYTPSGFLLESIVAADFDQKFVYKKYANKSECRRSSSHAHR